MDAELSAEEILRQKNRVPPCVVNGFAMPVKYLENKNAIDNFVIYDDDTLVCSYPKTGTTWTEEMVWLITHNVNFDVAKTDIDSRFCFLEAVSFLSNCSEKSYYPPFIKDSIKFCENFERPRYIKTHIPFDLLPKQIQNGSKKPKIIYITRNPKDVCTSAFYHELLYDSFTGNFEEFCKMFLEEDKYTYNPYYKHVRSYVNRKNDLDILFLKYEDMKKDLVPVIKKVAKFLNVQLSDEKILELKEHLSFESMKNNQFVNHRTGRNPKGQFMRSGKVGSFKEDMSDKIEKQFDVWINEHFKGLDDYIHLNV